MRDERPVHSSDTPSPGRGRRLARYVRKMAPPTILIPFGATHFLAVYFGLQALAGSAPLRLTWRAGPGMLSVILFMLLLRVYDELKDVESDLRLAQAGDPRYKDRPIVKGDVTVEDLRALRWLVTGLLVAANLPLGFPLPLAAFAAAFLLTWLSFKWFFWPAMKANLVLAFVTHNPLTLVIAGYVAAVYVRDFGPTGLNGWIVPLLIGLWMPVAAWETSRKIRIPEDETAYDTYSKVLGWRVAALVPVLFIATSVACLLPVARAAGLGWVCPAVLMAAATVPVGACVLFRVAPTRKRAKLRPCVELYATAANLGLAAALGARYGVALG